MFESLTERLNQVFRSVLGRGKLSDDNIAEAIGEIKTTLLEADVNAAVAAAFIDRVRASALGMDIVPGVSPGQFFIKVINDQLVSLLGGSNAGISWAASGPSVVMLCGLQGAGKTTTAAKLAHRWKAAGKRPLLVAADVQRPAAIEQLTTLGGQVGVPVFSQVGGDPVDICQRSRAVASEHQADVIILDTAGRLHLDDVLMQELEAINQAVNPAEILF
ncbi:MAG: signal recognition particle receptor subunit alpha, partial [Planctomycetota bacterium]|nr:signal recognition particle receptor subunit alpha [Planctomycetota bacterium]